MKLDELFPSDRERRIDGKRHVVAEDGTWLLIAPWHNHLHLRALVRLGRLGSRGADDEKQDLETEDRLDCRAMAQAILRGWGGPGMEPYSVDTAEEALYTKLVFRDKVTTIALEEQKRALEEEIESGKGSPNGSSPRRRGRPRKKPNGDGSNDSKVAEATSLVN